MVETILCQYGNRDGINNDESHIGFGRKVNVDKLYTRYYETTLSHHYEDCMKGTVKLKGCELLLNLVLLLKQRFLWIHHY